MPFSLEVAGKSDVGRVRQNNEDAFALDGERGIFVVCDGMGGQASGEVASQVACDAIMRYVAGSSPQSVARDLLAAALRTANRAIRERQQQDEALQGMGTTAVALLLREGNATVAHVGDSRAYLWRGEELRQLTEDHSLVREQVRRGILTAEQARGSDLQNILLRALGPEDEVESDVAEFTPQPGDVFLLATDGLTGMVDDPAIASILQRNPRPSSAVEELLRAANAAGGADNVTCIVVRVSGVS